MHLYKTLLRSFEFLSATACAAVLMSACHVTPAKDDARHAQGRFMDLWQTYSHRSEERRVGKECRSRWSPYH